MRALFCAVLLVGCSSVVPETPRPVFSGNYAVQVPGKPGFFYSPYALGEVWIDATGLASGTKVKCPVTDKVIMLP